MARTLPNLGGWDNPADPAAPLGSGLLFRLSKTMGTGGMRAEQFDPAQSLGRYCAATTLASGVPGNLFAGMSIDEARSGGAQYRCVFACNDSATVARAMRVSIVAAAGGGSHVGLGVDPTGATPSYLVWDTLKADQNGDFDLKQEGEATPIAFTRVRQQSEWRGEQAAYDAGLVQDNVANDQAVWVVGGGEAPPGVVFGDSAYLGDLNPGACRAFWVRRVAGPGSLSLDGAGLRLVGADTAKVVEVSLSWPCEISGADFYHRAPLADAWGPRGPNDAVDRNERRMDLYNWYYAGHTFSGTGRRRGNVPPNWSKD